jgi:RNA polymerase sigma-70 factor (ECF subfamily)
VVDEPELSAVQVRQLESARSGDVDAFGELVNVNYPDVRVFMAMHLGNQPDLDDLVQDVFVRAFAGLNTLRQTSAFRSWLIGIARNRVLEYLRERIRTATADNSTLELLLYRSELDILDAGDDDARRVLELEALRDCIRRLPPESGRMIREHYFRGRSINELATDARKKEGAIRVMMFRLRAALRDCVRSRVRPEEGV